jgi:hypothetical protein
VSSLEQAGKGREMKMMAGWIGVINMAAHHLGQISLIAGMMMQFAKQH